MSINDTLADDITARTITLARYDASLRRDVLALLRQVEKDIVAALPGITSEINKARRTKQLNEVRQLIANGYVEITQLTEKELSDLGVIEAKWQRSSINGAAGFELAVAMPTEAALAAITRNTLVQGAPSAAWWAKQDANLQFQFTNAVRTGLAQSESTGQIIKRVRQVMDVSRRDAASLVRTSVQAVAVEARDMTLKANSDVVKGKIQVSTLDSRTTFLCASRNGATYNLANEPIAPKKMPYIALPAHFQCRSAYSPLTKSFRELGLDIDEFSPSTRASMDGQIPAETTFEQFLDRKGKSWQNEYLGPGRAELWRSGSITLNDLVGSTGRELTLDQLRKL